MEKIDVRKVSAETLEILRKQAVSLRKKGYSFVAIGEIIGVRRQTVSDWRKSCREAGVKSFKPKKRGKPVGAYRILNPSHEKAIQDLIAGSTPDRYKLIFALWTREAVCQLIKERLGVRMPIRTAGEYLSRWGFTPQKPLKRAYEQRPAEVRKWLDEEYPAVAARAKAENAEIHRGDETGVRSDCQHGRSYSPRGKTPVIRLSARRTKLNMISSVTNQGKVRFMVYEETMTARLLICFMERLIRDARKKVFLILDNLRVHHAGKVKQWLEDHKLKIEVFYLPAYSPELNPDEYLNCDLKAGVHSKAPARDRINLKKKVIAHMRKLQKLPERIRKYFKHPKIAYAA